MKSNSTFVRQLRRLGLALAVMVIAAPAAQARVDAGTGAPEAPGASFAHDQQEPRPIVTDGEVVASPKPATVISADAFDWGDAGIGAGTLFAVALLGAGGAFMTRHTIRARHATTPTVT
jgi:hypothetical protein